MSTRRQFLVSSSTVVAALGLSPVTSVGVVVQREKRFRSLHQLSYASLKEQINTLFRVQVSPGRIVELRLLKAPLVRPTPAGASRRPPADADNEKFSLIFAGPGETILESAIHRFEHDELGEFEMYIGCIGSPLGREMRYEAGFNRPAPVASAALA